jgi:hypothetical protein
MSTGAESSRWRHWFETHRAEGADLTSPGPRLSASEEDILAAMRPATPELLARRTLLRRIDTKFVFPRRELLAVLGLMCDRFDLVHAADALVGIYHNLYFDTPGRRFFHAHRRGLRPRHKVRIRHYVERQMGFFELKTRDKYEFTTKTRQPHAFGDFELTPENGTFLDGLLGGLQVAPSARVDFPRMTLVGRDFQERITLDLGLTVRLNGGQYTLPAVVIGEIKQERFRARSPGMLAMRTRHLRPQRISKYCIAMSLLEPDLPAHRFRNALRELRRQHDA